jgi:hypothetical protein
MYSQAIEAQAALTAHVRRVGVSQVADTRAASHLYKGTLS